MSALSSYLQPPRQVRWFVLAALALAGLSAWLAMEAYLLHGKAAEHKARSERLLARQEALSAAKPTRQQLEEQKRWAALKQEQDFPWQRVFQSVERANSVDIELLEFLPDKRNRVIVLRGEARSPEALVGYLDALAMQRAFGTVHLLHQLKAVRGRLETVAFEIKATLIEGEN
ncbi:MAG TPA: hypothetical protein VEC06_03800 [Paucimonas sp.]|nr:hypothetical protein [Paucimonas sp.]